MYYHPPTNCHRLDPNTFFQVGIGCIVGILGLKDSLAAEGVDECSPALKWSVHFRSSVERMIHRTGSAGTAHHETELDALLHILLSPDLHIGQSHVISREHDGKE